MYPIYVTNCWVFFLSHVENTATEVIGKVLKVRNLFSFIGGELTVPWESAWNLITQQRSWVEQQHSSLIGVIDTSDTQVCIIILLLPVSEWNHFQACL